MTAKERLHQLIEGLPEGDVPAAERLLICLRDVGTGPLLRALMAAPDDDEPETPEEAKAVALARRELARGEGIPWEDVRSRLLKDR